jgi:hypothetical protein
MTVAALRFLRDLCEASACFVLEIFFFVRREEARVRSTEERPPQLLQWREELCTMRIQSFKDYGG